MKTFLDYLREADEDKKKTKTKDKTDWSAFDNYFGQPSDSNLPSAPQPDQPQNEPTQAQTPPLRRASQADTQRATRNITPTDQMRDLMGRMRDIEGEPEDDEGYPEPQEVTPTTLPTVINHQLTQAGVQNPEWHTVANLPGNMARGVRMLGKALFRSFTRTPTDDIVMLGNLGGQGPNTRAEINAVASWVTQNGEDVGVGNIDFERSIPGYNATIRQFSAGGARFLLVRDQFGDYIYTWPESASVDAQNQQQIGQDRPRLGR